MPDSRELVEILGIAPLERHALLVSRQGRRKVFASYLAMREKVACDFLPIINSREPYMNDHSRTHLERVLSHMESILELNFPKAGSRLAEIPQERVLTWADTLILLNALVWHDIGNMYGRKNHTRTIRECFDKLSGTLYDPYLAQHIVQVAEAHSGSDAIGKTIPDERACESYRGEDIHLQFLAAVLRFADEIDEDNRRSAPAEWEQLDLVPLEKQRFWFFSSANSSVQVKQIQGEHNLRLVVDIESHVPRSRFGHPFETDSDQRVEACTEYFRRIRKMENEREYCSRYMRSAYYHGGVSEIRVRLATHESGSSPISSEVFKFTVTAGNDLVHLASDPRLEPLWPYITNAAGYNG